MITDKVALKIDYQMTSFTRHRFVTNQKIRSDVDLSVGMSAKAQAIHAAFVWHF